jgi:hypothetical protein
LSIRAEPIPAHSLEAAGAMFGTLQDRLIIGAANTFTR